MRPTSRNPDRPILITEAPINADDEYNHRRKRYLIMMIIRALCVIGAASTFQYSGWLAAAFIPAALVLPWSAVLIANNRPPKQALKFRRFLPGGDGRHELTAGSDPASGTRRAAGGERTTGPRPAGERPARERMAEERMGQEPAVEDWMGEGWTGEERAAGGQARQPEQAAPRIIDI